MRLIHKIDNKNNVGAGFHPCPENNNKFNANGVGRDAHIDPIKNKIKIFVGIILMVLLSGGIGAYADYKYRATDIKYTNDKSVSQALNELYGIKTNLDALNSNLNLTDATVTDIKKGKKALTESGLITGEYDGLTTGEMWCLANKAIVGQGSGATAAFAFNDIDFSDIKTITYHFSGGQWNVFMIRDGVNGGAVYENTSNSSSTVDIEQNWNSSRCVQINITKGQTFYIDSYTTR